MHSNPRSPSSYKPIDQNLGICCQPRIEIVLSLRLAMNQAKADGAGLSVKDTIHALNLLSDRPIQNAEQLLVQRLKEIAQPPAHPIP